MNYYSIMKSSNSLFADDTVVQARNSKEALEKMIGKKVCRVVKYYDKFDYSVMLSDEQGRHNPDRRQTVYYVLKD